MGMRRAGYGIATIGVAVVLGWAGVAVACTVVPQVSYSLLPESATPGSTVVVRGEAVRSGHPVEIRWDGVKGELLAVATAEDGAFSVPVQVPDVAPGIYSLMLVTADAGVGRTAFEVVGAPSAAAPTVETPWVSAGDDVAGVAQSAGGPSGLGVALLAVGLVGLFAGSAVAVASRRRVLAGPRP